MEIDIRNEDNEIPYINNMIMDYINTVLQNKGHEERCSRMTINFCQLCGPIVIRICAYNSKDDKISEIFFETIHWGEKRYYKISYTSEDDWSYVNIKNKRIIQEYNKVYDDIIDKYF